MPVAVEGVDQDVQQAVGVGLKLVGVRWIHPCGGVRLTDNGDGSEEGQGGEEGHERARQDPPTGRGRQRHEWKSLFSSLL